MTHANPPTPGSRGRLIVYGAGGHGQVVAEAASLSGWQVVGLVDDKPADELDPGPWPILPQSAINDPAAHFIVTIGDNFARRRVSQDLSKSGRRMATVIHPAASVSPTAKIAQNVFVGPLAVVHTGATIGEGAIVNTSAIVEHHCRVGAWTHLAPGSAIGGAVSVGEMTLIGLGACVLPEIKIGSRCTIGAGAVIIEPVGDNQTVVGVPGRNLSQRPGPGIGGPRDSALV